MTGAGEVVVTFAGRRITGVPLNVEVRRELHSRDEATVTFVPHGIETASAAAPDEIAPRHQRTRSYPE